MTHKWWSKRILSTIKRIDSKDIFSSHWFKLSWFSYSGASKSIGLSKVILLIEIHLFEHSVILHHEKLMSVCSQRFSWFVTEHTFKSFWFGNFIFLLFFDKFALINSNLSALTFGEPLLWQINNRMTFVALNCTTVADYSFVITL